MASFTHETSQILGTLVFRLQGYFDGDAGKAVLADVDSNLQAGRVRMVFDFSGCDLINSPGIAAFFVIIRKTLFDFEGKICLAGLDPLKVKVFTMSGILPMVEKAETVDEALKLLGGA